MKFSIIIPVFNRPDEINDLIQSIIDQKYIQPQKIVLRIQVTFISAIYIAMFVLQKIG